MPVNRLRLERVYWAASAASLLLLALTLVEPQWIERLLDESPDGGDGSAERWLVGGCFAVLAALSAWLARREQGREPPRP